MTKDILLQLRGRIAKATGPNYALDCKIEHLFAPERARQVGNALPYTASLDAAVTLVPEDQYFTIEHLKTGDWVTFKHAGYDVARRAKTLPLALCLARVEYELAALDAAGKQVLGVSAEPHTP